MAGLVFIGLVPSALSMTLFIHILVAWASIQIFSMNISLFAKLRLPFVIIIALLLVETLVIVLAIALTDDHETQQAIVVKSSYALAALYASVCAMVSCQLVALLILYNQAHLMLYAYVFC